MTLERVAEINETEAERDRLAARVGKLEADLSAVRGWTRSRLEILGRLSYRTIAADSKMAVLDDLTRVLDHLDTIPAPNAGADATSSEEPTP